MEITENIKKRIKEHALSDVQNEVCGIILENGTVIPCVNRASDSEVHFIIARADLKRAQKIGWISAVYHSHVPGDYIDESLSDEDKVIAEYFNIFSVMYSIQNDKFYEYQPTGKPIEYIGRPYVRGILDEMQLIRDYYKKELNIDLIDLKDKNAENFLRNNGFIETNSPNKHDIIIIKWSGDKNNKKMAIYYGDNKILAHPEFELSKIINYNYGLVNWTEKIFRHHKL